MLTRSADGSKRASILLLGAGPKPAAPFCPRAEQNTIPFEFAFNMSLNIATLACFENI